MDVCTFVPGWACQQPGSPGLAEIEGPIPIPGAGGTQYVDALGVPQGWGQVPQRGSFTCWCVNAAGTFANESSGCVAEPCPYASRCVNRVAGVLNNGTSCAHGSEGLACISCVKRWYRYRDECRPCPEGIPISVVLLCIGFGGA